jgi:hypothetical protein
VQPTAASRRQPVPWLESCVPVVVLAVERVAGEDAHRDTCAGAVVERGADSQWVGWVWGVRGGEGCSVTLQGEGLCVCVCGL